MSARTLARRPRARGVAALATAACLVLAGCAQDAGDAADVEASDEGCDGDAFSLTQSTTGFLYLPSYIAEEQGYYEEQGLDVSIRDLGGGSENVAAVVSGSADVALTAYTSIVTAREEGAAVVAIDSLMNQYASNIVISQEAADAAGVDENSSPEDKIRALEGLRLGITSPGSGTDQLFRYLFDQVGLDAEDDAELLSIGSGSPMIAAFRSGQIDGFSLSSPTSDQAAAEDGVMLFDLSSGDYEPLNPFLYIVAVANSRDLEDNARILTCFSRAIAQALELIAEDPEAAKEAGRPAFSEIDDQLYDEAFERNVAAYPETPVIDAEEAQVGVDFVADFEGTLEEASVETTVNTNLAEAASQ